MATNLPVLQAAVGPDRGVLEPLVRNSIEVVRARYG